VNVTPSGKENVVLTFAAFGGKLGLSITKEGSVEPALKHVSCDWTPLSNMKISSAA
jgi:hypothetical protein